jgi:amidase
VLAAADPRDPATVAEVRTPVDYRTFLRADGLRGMRIGVARKRVTGYSAHADRLFEQALRDLQRLGAELVDPADFGALGEYDEDEMEVLLYELKDGLDRYLATRSGVPVRTLAEVIAFNRRNADTEMPHFGQELFERAQAKGPLTEPAYLNAALKARRLAREGIDKPLRDHRLDAIVAPTGSPAWLTDPVNGDAFLGSSSAPAAVAGYPAITVPMGQAEDLPVGLTFVGTAWSEGKLLQAAHAYEQATRHRKPPVLRPARALPLVH